MRQEIADLRLVESVEERESLLFSLAAQCGTPLEIMSCRDDRNGIDIFLIEFDAPDEAMRANMLLGLTVVADSNVASVIIPTNTFH